MKLELQTLQSALSSGKCCHTVNYTQACFLNFMNMKSGTSPLAVVLLHFRRFIPEEFFFPLVAFLQTHWWATLPQQWLCLVKLWTSGTFPRRMWWGQRWTVWWRRSSFNRRVSAGSDDDNDDANFSPYEQLLRGLFIPLGAKTFLQPFEDDDGSCTGCLQLHFQ